MNERSTTTFFFFLSFIYTRLKNVPTNADLCTFFVCFELPFVQCLEMRSMQLIVAQCHCFKMIQLCANINFIFMLQLTFTAICKMREKRLKEANLRQEGHSRSLLFSLTFVFSVSRLVNYFELNKSSTKLHAKL